MTLPSTRRRQPASRAHQIAVSPPALPATVGPAAAGTHSVRPMVVVVALSLLAGFVAAIVLALGVAAGATEPVVTGSVLLAFGSGWALLAILTGRLAGEPQRWAAVPAAFLGLTGLALVVLAPTVAAMDVISWIWPPALLLVVAWSIRHVRRDLRGRSRWLLYPVFTVLLLAGVGGAAETVLAAVDRSAGPTTGQLVEVDGRTMHIDCRGSGSPTVILESGLGEASFYWAHIAPAVGATTRVCAYDRAGYGWSDPPVAA